MSREWKEKEEEATIPFKWGPSMTWRPPRRTHLIKFPAHPSGASVGTKPLTHGPFGDILDPDLLLIIHSCFPVLSLISSPLLSSLLQVFTKNYAIMYQKGSRETHPWPPGSHSSRWGCYRGGPGSHRGETTQVMVVAEGSWRGSKLEWVEVGGFSQAKETQTGRERSSRQRKASLHLYLYHLSAWPGQAQPGAWILLEFLHLKNFLYICHLGNILGFYKSLSNETRSCDFPKMSASNHSHDRSKNEAKISTQHQKG